jgi:hypothetical protein
MPATSSQLLIQFDYTPVGTASTNDYFDITGVQLEQNYQPTPFEQRPIGVELQLCQRYFYDNGTSFITYNGFTTSNVQKWTSAQFPVRMRATPTITIFDGVGTAGKLSTLDTAGTGTNNIDAALVSAYVTSMDVLISSTASGLYYSFRAASEL